MNAPTLQPFESLWDAQDVARFLKVSRSWVYQATEAGKVPHRRVGALLRFDPEEIRAWVRGQTVQPASLVRLPR